MSLPVYHRVLSLLGSVKTDVRNKNKSIGEFVIHMFLLLCFFPSVECEHLPFLFSCYYVFFFECELVEQVLVLCVETLEEGHGRGGRSV